MMLKNEKFILSHSKEHRTSSEVCKDMIADTMRLYFMLRHAGYPEKKCYSMPFNCGKSCGFSLLNKDTQYPLIFMAILALFESEFSVMDRPAIYV